MAESSAGAPIVAEPARLRSLATRVSLFSYALVLWIVATLSVYDLVRGTFDLAKGVLLFAIIAIATVFIRRFGSSLGRPLAQLESRLSAVRSGRFEPIELSGTRDEVELLGESFNRMIGALANSEKALVERQRSEQQIKNRADQLASAMQGAQAANRAKSEFLASMSHELRTPMHGIIGMLDLALDRPQTPEAAEQLEIAQRCAYSLLSLLNDILDLSKIEAGKMTIEKVPFDLRALVADSIETHQPQAAERSVALRVEVSPDLPQRVSGDPLRIRQIIVNLVGNAVKFTEHGAVEVRVGGHFTQPGQFLVEIMVKDSGTGIPADKLLAIFDQFTQANDSDSRRFGGTGLGLAITRRLVELHGGEIKVDSELGQGTTFTATITCGTEPAPETGGEKSIVAAPASSSEAGAPARILVVEDNHVNQKVVTAVLRKRGFYIELANDGQEALNKLEQCAAFDLVLMDVQMPVLDGLEATRMIRRETRWNRLPIIAMTAHAMNGDRERCLDAGMNGYISKPVHPSLLLSTVDEFLMQKAG